MSDDQQRYAYFRILNRVQVLDHKIRREAMDEAIEFAKSTEDKVMVVELTINELVRTRMEDGLSLARAILRHVGEPLLDIAEAFIYSDAARWSGENRLRHHADDDVCYVLLRTVASMEVSKPRTMNLIWKCLTLGNPSVRDAAIWALDDIGTDEAREMVESKGLKDCSASVRDAARFVLEGWK